MPLGAISIVRRSSAFADGGVLPLLEVAEDGSYVTDIVPIAGNPIRLTREEFAGAQAASRHLPSRSTIRTPRKRRWSAMPSRSRSGIGWQRRSAPYWRTYVRVMVAALFINLIALGSPLFTMNVYDRVLPNKAIPTLWVLAAGISLAYLFDFLLKTARSSLIDYAGRKADLRLSQLLFDKVLNSTLASRPMSTGEYANRVTQYEFVREFFTSNTIGVLIDSLFVFIFLSSST